MSLHPSHESRRRFLQMLAASPILPHLELPRDWMRKVMQQGPELITSAAEALNVFDFEPVAQKKLPPAHWGYLATGTDDDATIKANRDGMSRYELRVRRLVDGSKTDLSVNILGKPYATPIVINPVGSNKAFHPQGELAVARAAKAKGSVQVLSNVATTSIEDASEARGEPVWSQLYYRTDWTQTLGMVKRAERAGAPALVFTVDLIGGSNRETLERYKKMDTRDCTNCHKGSAPQPGRSGQVDDRDNSKKPMLAAPYPGTPKPEVGTPTWEYVKRLRDATPMKLFLKGIVTREDAELAIENGANGVFVSNHGGRAENSTRATIECLNEVVAGIRGRGTVIVDGGFRRGTDVFKALALGANGVGIGRPYIWGLASFGQEGVEAVLELLRKELLMTMRQAGTTNISKITKAYIIDRQAR